MDIMLERILSLIPQKQDGGPMHGALKEFAENIGLKSGNVISDWKNGRSKSYESYIYEIANKYNVSVEWLRGETDKKNPPPKVEDGLSEQAAEILRLYDLAPPALQAAALAVLRSAEADQTAPGGGKATK